MQFFLQELLSRDAITTVFQNTLLTGMTVEFPKTECKLLSIYLYIFIVERKKKKNTTINTTMETLFYAIFVWNHQKEYFTKMFCSIRELILYSRTVRE